MSRAAVIILILFLLIVAAIMLLSNRAREVPTRTMEVDVAANVS